MSMYSLFLSVRALFVEFQWFMMAVETRFISCSMRDLVSLEAALCPCDRLMLSLLNCIQDSGIDCLKRDNMSKCYSNDFIASTLLTHFNPGMHFLFPNNVILFLKLQCRSSTHICVYACCSSSTNFASFPAPFLPPPATPPPLLLHIFRPFPTLPPATPLPPPPFLHLIRLFLRLSSAPPSPTSPTLETIAHSSRRFIAYIMRIRP